MYIPRITAGNEDFFLAREGEEFLLIDEDGEVVFRGTYQEMLYFLNRQAEGEETYAGTNR